MPQGASSGKRAASVRANGRGLYFYEFDYCPENNAAALEDGITYIPIYMTCCL
ncbi:MAG: hypothetical protein IJ828_03625 [Treponema sp.]|nr:hypothetical protein [Treponema sp.]